jgi:hypothetical protein
LEKKLALKLLIIIVIWVTAWTPLTVIAMLQVLDLSPVFKTKLCSGTGKARPKLGRLVIKTFFCIIRKRASLGRDLSATDQSFMNRAQFLTKYLQTPINADSVIFFANKKRLSLSRN